MDAANNNLYAVCIKMVKKSRYNNIHNIVKHKVKILDVINVNQEISLITKHAYIDSHITNMFFLYIDQYNPTDILTANKITKICIYLCIMLIVIYNILHVYPQIDIFIDVIINHIL